MERNREGRRSMGSGDALTRRRRRRRHRTTNTTDSPDEDAETTRLRDRLHRTKNTTPTHEDEYTSDESFNHQPHKSRMLPLNPHRKTFPHSQLFRPTPPPSWKPADEMIGVSVPRKARSASTKRSHDSTAGILSDHFHPHPFTSSPSPSSSNLSVRKKIVKPNNNNNNNNNNNGNKFKLLKSSSSKTSSPAQDQEDEIEIEIAQVLYGMMTQPQPSSLNHLHSAEGNKSESFPPQNSTSDIIPMSVVAPKRKRPRQVKYEEESQSPATFTVRSSPISSTSKAQGDHPSKVETCSQNFDENTGIVPESGAVSSDLASLEGQAESIKVESNVSSHSKMLTEESEKQDVELSNELVTPQSPNKESTKLDVDHEVVKSTKSNLTLYECENQREQKFQIDLMSPPPLLRSSPERKSENNFVAGDPKPLVTDADMEVKPVLKEGEKSLTTNKEEVVGMEMDESETQKPIITQKGRDIDFQLDLEKGHKAEASGNDSIITNNQHQNNIQKQRQQPNSEKNVVSNPMPLPLSVPNWSGGLPPMGYMTTLPGVVSVDGTTVTSAAIPPRPKRCATHCYIARNILYHQQIAKMNPFWPAAAGSASLYGAKPCNLNVVTSAELHANVPSRAPNPTQDKDQALVMFPGQMGKDKGSQPTSVDNSQQKQLLLQQALPPGTPSNILGPAFIFPLNQQHAAAAAAASVRPGSMKSFPLANSAVSSFTANSAPQNASGTGATAVPPMSFSYPNMAGNETQYLAILQNNAYPFPIPAHVGGPPAYRGTQAQALPFFNGSFYSSQMLHPSQIQQQPQLQQTQQGHHASISSGSSSSQKHVQNQQQMPNASGSTGGVGASGGSMQGSPVTKNHSSKPLQLQQQQQRQQLQNHHASHPAHQIETEMGSADSPSADSRQTRATMSIYGQNFAMPVQTPNFALMTPAPITGTGPNGGHVEKKQAQEHPGPKGSTETSQAFAMSFASINGATSVTGFDPSYIAQSHHSIMQNHHNYQIMAAAQAASAQQKKNYHVVEDGKNAVDSSNLDEDRKPVGGKIPATVGQSIAFSRPDASDPSITALTGNNVVDSSARTLNLGSGSINTSVASSQQHRQRNQQQIIQKQNQFATAAAAAARSKTPSTSNGSVYSDHHPSTLSMNSKFPNAVSMFPQNLVQCSSTVVAQSPQRKNSARASISQFPLSMASPPSSSVKTLPQHQARSQQAHSQISFSANPKSTSIQVQPLSSTQSPSPPIIVGSPTTSSVSKNTGSPRTTSTSTDNKISQTALASQQTKNTQAGPSSKSGRNMPSILSGPQLTNSSTGTKPQLPQQQQQQQISKQAVPHAQLFMSNPYYIHSQVSQSNSPTSTTSAANGYYLQRRGHDQMQTQMQRQSSSGTNSNGAAGSNTKGSGLPTPGLPHPAQFASMSQAGNHHPFVVPAGFPYVHAVPAAVQVKPAEQKQPAAE
ncbi:hypothetical protein Lalb_Chr09g0319791 [Lupinus albus]|uniref:Protein TIME FOR COFFEE n=1 Tax=Lupinus albus TaxID=3870 RepID=A0A6A4PYB1_LUPAL|nr:hypothetical protein Lalb_Chr09g0319791 [Lupinus albus]